MSLFIFAISKCSNIDLRLTKIRMYSSKYCFLFNHNKVCSHFIMIKQEAALALVHSNLSQSKVNVRTLTYSKYKKRYIFI